MNDEEFDLWRTEHRRRFPQVAEWLSKLEHEAEMVQLRQWADDLATVSLEDASEVSRQMQAGEMEHPARWDYPLIGSIVARAARRRSRRREATEMPSPPRGRFQGLLSDEGPISLRDAMAKVAHLVKSGRTAREAMVELGIRGAADDEGGRRHACRRCEDSGMVEVWGRRAWQAYLDDRLDRAAERTTAAIPCDCAAGAARLSKREGLGFTYGYDPLQHCLAKHGDTHSPAAIEEFRAWCVGYRERLAPPREPAFDEWNNRG